MNSMVLAQLPIVLAFVALLLLASFYPKEKGIASTWISILGLLASAHMVFHYLPIGATYFGGAYVITSFGKMLVLICLILLVLSLLLCDGYLQKIHVHFADWKMLCLAAGLGSLSLGLSGDLATVFISFELISIPSYVLCGFSKRDPRSNEAGIKYLLLGALGSALFLLGIAFVYGATGEIQLSAISDKLLSGGSADLAMAKLGMALILAALFFKTGVAPFHIWIADVYQGSSFAALSVIASPIKVAAFGLMYLFLSGPFAALASVWKPCLLIMAALSAIIGNFQAATQSNLKRLFAYSAVAHGAFLLLALASGSNAAFLFYLITYGIMSTGIWAAFMSYSSNKADIDEAADLAGLGKKHPLFAFGLSLLILSYAGLPITAGFTAKLGAVLEAFRHSSQLGSWALPLIILILVSTLVSFYYYLQLLRHIWFIKQTHEAAAYSRHMLWNQNAVFAFSVLMIVTLGLIFQVPTL